MIIYDFSKGVNEQELFYAWSPQSRTPVKFTMGDGCIVSKEIPLPEGQVRTYNDYEHISLLTKKRYGVGTTITVECDFEVFGAPLLLLTNDLITINGNQSYDRHIEVVGFESGFNVWDITYAPDKPERRYIAPKKVAFERFKIENNERITIITKILEDGILVTVNGVTSKVELNDIGNEFYVGLTACEGINRFYSLKIEE